MMAFALKPPSKAIITKGLEKTLEEKQREVDVLHAENVALRTREAVLLQQVHQQGDNLHFVALAASQVPPEDAPDMSKTLMLDLEVLELMERIGRSNSNSNSNSGSNADEEPFTTQRLRAAVTPERVAAMRRTTVEEVAAHLKQLTMRMFMLLGGGPSKASYFSDTLEAVVNEYGEYGLLLHVAADRIALQLGTINLDTLAVQEPPPGFWSTVVDSLELTEEQVQSLATGFQNYQQKSKPIINTLHGTVSSIRAILDADESLDSTQEQMQGGSAGSSSSRAQPFWQFLHNTLNSSVVGGVSTLPPGDRSNAITIASTAAALQPQDGGSNNALAALTAAAGGGNNIGSSNNNLLQSNKRGSACGLDSATATNTGGNSSSATAFVTPGTNGSTNGSTTVKPWHEFGLSHGCLSAGTTEELEQHMDELMQQTMKLREMHRTVTWLFLNTLNARQHALFITGSWPWWSRPLTMCQHIAEQHEQQQQQHKQRLSSPGVSNRLHSGGQRAAAVAEGVLQLSLDPMQQQQQQGGSQSGQQPHHQQQQQQQQQARFVL